MAIPMTQSLLAVALSMGIYITNSSLFFYYSNDARSLFGKSAINALLSGYKPPPPPPRLCPPFSHCPLWRTCEALRVVKTLFSEKQPWMLPFPSISGPS